MEINSLTEYTGAEISGIDLRSVDDDIFSIIQDTLYDRGVIFFRDQHLTPSEQAEFCQRLGSIDVNSNIAILDTIADEPRVRIVSRGPEDGRNNGGFWHTDQSFMSNPPKLTCLSAVNLPSYGGDTMFAHLSAAYDKLSDGMKATLQTLKSVHKRTHLYGSDGVPNPDVTKEFYDEICDKWSDVEFAHPLIKTHPQTNRKGVFFGPRFSDRIEGWTREESMPIFKYLSELVTRPEHVYRHKWNVGDLLIIDNRTVMHYALDDYPGQRRLMHRVVIDF